MVVLSLFPKGWLWRTCCNSTKLLIDLYIIYLRKATIFSWAYSQSRYPKGWFNKNKWLQRTILDFYYIYYFMIIVDWYMTIIKMDIILMSFWVLLNNLSPCVNCNFHLKGIKRNVLNNAIDFNFLSWISNAYIYVWQCSYNALY